MLTVLPPAQAEGPLNLTVLPPAATAPSEAAASGGGVGAGRDTVTDALMVLQQLNLVAPGSTAAALLDGAGAPSGGRAGTQQRSRRRY